MTEAVAVHPNAFGALLLDIGVGLIRAGATAKRITETVNRFASTYTYAYNLDIGPKYISLTLLDKNAHVVFSGTRGTSSYGVNFKIISGIQRLSITVGEKELPFTEARKELDRLLQLPHYSRFVVLLVVSIAGAAFCYNFGGSLSEMGVAFGATFCGLFLKQQLQKKSFNPYGCTFLSALLAALVVGAFHMVNKDMVLERAFATCTLFLIPGVPLINGCIDLIEGNIIYGLERGVNAMIHALAIAFGLSLALIIYNVQA